MPTPHITRPSRQDQARAKARSVQKPAGCKACAAKRAAAAAGKHSEAARSRRKLAGSSTNRWTAPQ